MLSRSAKSTRLIAIAKVMPAAPMRRRRLFFLAKIYPFSPSCLTSPSTRMLTFDVAGTPSPRICHGILDLLLLTQDRVSPDQSQPPVEIVLRGLLNESLHHPTDRLRPLLWRRRRNASPFSAGPRGLQGGLQRFGSR